MEGKGENSHTSFTTAITLTKSGAANVPECYILPPADRPNPGLSPSMTLPIVDLSFLHHPSLRSHVVDEIRSACIQVINHGIPLHVMKDALEAAKDFFDLPLEEKMRLMSDNVHAQDEIGGGSQVMAINCYPACPEPQLTLGMPPHSDYGSLTILLQSCTGLQLMDQNKHWFKVPVTEGALMVQLGDQLEVMSNGQYKSVVHRATVNSEKKRFSIASLHSLALNKKVGPAPELVDEQHPASYKEFSFKDFLDFISNNDILQGRFINKLKRNPIVKNCPYSVTLSPS